MSTLKERLGEDLKSAMKRGDAAALSTLRMVVAALKNKEIEKHVAELPDEDVLATLATEARKRKESAAGFRQGGREDLAVNEEKELALIKGYLPEGATEQEVRAAVEKAIKDTGASDIKDMGKVMGMAMKALKNRAEGGAVQQMVKELLAK